MNAESNLMRLVIADLSPVKEMISFGVYIYICLFHGSSQVIREISTRSNSV